MKAQVDIYIYTQTDVCITAEEPGLAGTTCNTLASDS